MKNIVITGGRGYLCYELVKNFSHNSNINVSVATSNVNATKKQLDSFKADIFSNEDLVKGNFPNGPADCLVHTAFCRKDNGKNLVESLQFAEKVFRIAAVNGIDIINISSQAVYGADEKEQLPTESACLCPGYPYAVAKAASEILLESIMKSYGGQAAYTNIRLAALIGPGYFIPDNITYKFMLNALKGNAVNIIGGKQKFSFLDVRDAADALCKLIIQGRSWEKVYNLGPVSQTDIIYMAKVVNDCVESIGLPKVPIQIKEEKILLNAGMNSSRFYQQVMWSPKYSLKDTIQDCISVVGKEYEIERNKMRL